MADGYSDGWAYLMGEATDLHHQFHCIVTQLFLCYFTVEVLQQKADPLTHRRHSSELDSRFAAWAGKHHVETVGFHIIIHVSPAFVAYWPDINWRVFGDSTLVDTAARKTRPESAHISPIHKYHGMPAGFALGLFRTGISFVPQNSS